MNLTLTNQVTYTVAVPDQRPIVAGTRHHVRRLSDVQQLDRQPLHLFHLPQQALHPQARLFEHQDLEVKYSLRFINKCLEVSRVTTLKVKMLQKINAT